MHIVSITSDFGYQDYYVAELKAHILSQNPNIKIVDVSHSLDSYDIVQAAHFVNNIFRSFPKGSTHIIAVYNYYERNSRYIAIEREGHYFVAPDNGVLSLIFDDLRAQDTRLLSFSVSEDHISSIYGKAIGMIYNLPSFEDIGPVPETINIKMGINPVVTKTQIRATIIHIDHYENVVINVTKKQFESLRANREFQIYFKQNDPITKISNGYSDVHIGNVLALFNSAGYMVIGINMGKASSMLNLNKNETIQINFV